MKGVQIVEAVTHNMNTGLTVLVRDFEFKLLGVVSEDVAGVAGENEVGGQLVAEVGDVLRLVARAGVKHLGV